MNRELLKYILAKNKYKTSDLANWLGVSRQALNMRLMGETEFKLSEIRLICERLNLTEQELHDIFFDKMSIKN